MEHKKTKIIATLGPSSDDASTIEQLHNSGMNVARLNFSHGTYEYFANLISTIRSVSNEITILLDTKGPEIRTSKVENEQDIELQYAEKVFLDNDTSKYTTTKCVQLEYEHLFDVEVGDLVFIDDGGVGVEITKVSKEEKIIETKVTIPGKIGSKKTVSIRGHNVKIPFLSKKDRDDILYGIEQGVDVIAASFVREVQDVVELKEFLKVNDSRSTESGSPIKVISKIEHAQALENIGGIIEESFGVMVARGDLGVEAPIEKVPFIQENLIGLCNQAGKPVIVATQMLESMKNSKVPTRAEVNDVAQAILQGTDCVMLSGETANGKYPVEALSMMSKICGEYDSRVINLIDSQVDRTDESNARASSLLMKKEVSLFVTRSAYYAARDLSAQAILVPTESGYSARKISRFKPSCIILAVCRDMTVLRQLQLSWGVRAFYHEGGYEDQESMINTLVSELVAQNALDKDRRVVIASGKIVNKEGHTNTLEVYKVEDILSRVED